MPTVSVQIDFTHWICSSSVLQFFSGKGSKMKKFDMGYERNTVALTPPLTEI